VTGVIDLLFFRNGRIPEEVVIDYCAVYAACCIKLVIFFLEFSQSRARCSLVYYVQY